MGTKFTLIDNSTKENQNLLNGMPKDDLLTTEDSPDNHPHDFAGRKILIKVCGIGGGGGNAINRMIEAGMRGVDFVAINTDGQALFSSLAPIRVQIGKKVTEGLGAGCLPEIGAKSAEEDRDRIEEALIGANMAFLTAGMGGGTGTGAIPIVAEIAKNLGILTVAVVTLPFSFEGENKMLLAKEGIEKLRKFVDALIVIPNDRVADITEMPVPEAFLKVDEILHNGIRSVTDLITRPQLLNVDFADIRTVLQKSGHAHFGIGVAKGENRAEMAVLDAINSDLLKGRSVAGARSAILSVHGGSDMKIGEVKKAGDKLMEILGHTATIKLGAMIEKEPMEILRATVIIAGFPGDESFVQNYQPAPPYTNVNSTISSVYTKNSTGTNFQIEPVDYDTKFESKKIFEEKFSDTKSSTQSIINKEEIKGEASAKNEELFPRESYQSPQTTNEEQKTVIADIPTWLKKYISK